MICLAGLVAPILVGSTFLIGKRFFPVFARRDRVVGLFMVILLFAPLLFIAGELTRSVVRSELSASTSPIYPTRATLIQKGFYIFELPAQDVESRQWEQEIHIGSWDTHCGLLLGDTYNPLVIIYRNEDGIELFRIQQAWRMVWNIGMADRIQEFDLNQEFADPKILTVYTVSAMDSNLSQNLYRFEDWMGYNVDIASSLSVRETVELIRLLEYVGSPIETMNDPWAC